MPARICIIHSREEINVSVIDLYILVAVIFMGVAQMLFHNRRTRVSTTVGRYRVIKS